MSLTALFLGIALGSPIGPFPADTTKAPKPRAEAPAPAPPPAPKPAPKIEPRRDPPVKPLPLGEPKLKRRKLPD